MMPTPETETMSERLEFTCERCGWTSTDIGTFPNLAVPLCHTCEHAEKPSRAQPTLGV